MIQDLEQYRNQRTKTSPMTNGSLALGANRKVAVKPQLQIVRPIIEFPGEVIRKAKPEDLPSSIPEEVCNTTEGYVAPKAGERAKKIQSDGLNKVDTVLEEYRRTGIYTPAVARASYNAFTRLAIIRGNGNVLNVSGATELPSEVDPNEILEGIGRKTIGGNIQAVRYGRISLMVADVDEVDLKKLFMNLAAATKEVNSQHFSKEKAKVLNAIQDKRTAELLEEAERGQGVLDGTIKPNIAAISDESKGKEYFLWTGKRYENNVIKGINPDGTEQDQAELSKYAPDLVTKGLMAHELDLLQSVEEGKVRVIFIGDNEAYVKRCCVSASNEQQQQQQLVLAESNQRVIDLHPTEYSVVSDASGAIKGSSGALSGGAGGGYDSENCSSCGKSRYKEDGCKCDKGIK